MTALCGFKALCLLGFLICRSICQADPGKPCRDEPRLETILKTLVNKGFYTISLQNTT